MPSRARAGVVFGSVILLFAGCKEQSDAGRPLPAPEPPPAATSQLPSDDSASTKRRPAADDGAPPKPRAPKFDDVPAQPAPAAAPEPSELPTVGGGSSSGGGSSVPAPMPSIPPLTAPFAACLTRCQNALQGCLSQPVDAGVPGFANLDLCKKAFEACQAACN